MLPYFFYSFVRKGIGLGLSTLGILLLQLLHHVNLQTIQDPPKTTRDPWLQLLQHVNLQTVRDPPRGISILGEVRNVEI